MSWDLAWLEFLEEQELPHGSRQRFMEKIAASTPVKQGVLGTTAQPAPQQSVDRRHDYNVRAADWIASAAGRVTASRGQGIQ